MTRIKLFGCQIISVDVLSKISMQIIERTGYEQVNQILQDHCTSDSHCISCSLVLERLRKKKIIHLNGC